MPQQVTNEMTRSTQTVVFRPTSPICRYPHDEMWMQEEQVSVCVHAVNSSELCMRGKDDDVCCSADKGHILEINNGDELMRTRMKRKCTREQSRASLLTSDKMKRTDSVRDCSKNNVNLPGPDYSFPFLSFPLLRGDCGCRGWYVYPQSALRPCTVWPNTRFTLDVCKLVCEWVVCDSARGRCICVGGTLFLLPYVYSAWLRLFVSQGVG